MSVSRENAAQHGRGASWNPANRFDGYDYAAEEGEEYAADEDLGAPQTCFIEDSTRSILSHNDSPDVGFEYSINPYRGCEHGCIYCYARPTHEYLGFSAGLDFESKILYKPRAPQLLREALSARNWRPQPIALSGNTDCYQPIERRFQLTRGCLEVFAECRNPVAIITKNRLVCRDLDILKTLSHFEACKVNVSLTTLDLKLNRILEPRTSAPSQRLKTVRALAAEGIPVGVLVAPVIPGLTDHEIPTLLEAAAEAGASTAGFEMLRLPHAVAPLFTRWIEQHFPERKEKVLNRIRSLRGGKLNDPNFCSRMRGEGVFADQVERLFGIACAKVGLNRSRFELSAASFVRPGIEQMELF